VPTEATRRVELLVRKVPNHPSDARTKMRRC